MSGKARYTHGHEPAVVAVHAARRAADCAAYLLPHLAPGLSVLDVGCGPGSITRDFAGLVAPGTVTGVDSSSEVLAAASTAAAEHGVTNVRFQEGDAYALPFPDNSFDVVHAHMVLQHLQDPVAALRDMADGWRAWAAQPDAWHGRPHVELLARVHKS